MVINVATHCPECGKELVSENAEICPNCGFRLKSAPAEEKSAILAAILSVFITGLGQIYNGQLKKGIAYLAIMFVCWLSVMFLIGILLVPIWWLIGIYDAYRTAEKINAGEDISGFINT